MRQRTAGGIASASFAALLVVVQMTYPHLSPLIGVPLILICLIGIGAGMWFLFGSPRGGRPAKVALEKRATPSIGVEIDGANIFVPNQAPEKVGLALQTRVWRANGPPVYLLSWSLKIRLGKREIIAPPSAIPEVITLNGEQNAVLRAEDSLVEKVSSARLGDEPVEGVLLFYASAMKSDIMQPTTELILTVRDNLNRETTFRKRMEEWLTM